MDYKTNIQNSEPGKIDLGFVGKLLEETFHMPVYIPWFIGWDKKLVPYPDLKVINSESDYDNAPVRYGQKTWGAFWFKGGRYLNYDFNGELKEYSYSDILMPLASIVDFKRDKTVTKTPTVGGVGSVKEIYGLDDWTINIKGIILPDEYNPISQQTVEQQMEAIQKFHEIAGSIEVDGQIFAKRNIYRIVTENLTFNPVQGYPKMMQYSIDAVSDEGILITDLL